MDSLNVKREMVSLRIPPKVNRELAEHVRKMGISKNAFLIMLVKKALAESK